MERDRLQSVIDSLPKVSHRPNRVTLMLYGNVRQGVPVTVVGVIQPTGDGLTDDETGEPILCLPVRKYCERKTRYVRIDEICSVCIGWPKL